MLHALESLSKKFGEPVQGIHQLRIIGGETTEHYHFYVAGLQLDGNGRTVIEAVSELLKKCKVVAVIALAMTWRYRNQLPALFC
jgi:hypothetical protein